MRTYLIAALLLASASVATAQTVPALPTQPAPAASASFEARENWCEKYASWYVAVVPASEPTPADVRPTQRFETEFSSCKLDPQEYQRQTLAEVNRLSTSG